MSPLRRVPLSRKTPLRPGGPLAARSPRRRKQEREYKILRAAYLEGHPTCELCEEQPARELHHKRGRVGRDLLDVDHFAALCSPCHRFATENPAEAYRLGISERRIGGEAA